MRVPSSTPAGMLTDSVRSRVTRPAPRAGRTGIVDHLAAALTGRAGALEREEALRMPDLAGAAAGRAGLRLGAGLGAGAGAGFAGHRGRNADLRGLAVEGLLERDLHVVAQIGAALAAGRRRAARRRPCRRCLRRCRRRSSRNRRRSRARRPAALLEGGMAEAVIGGALVAVLEHVIGLVDFLEFVLAVLVARIAVRMMLHGELAERGLELDLGAGALNAQDFVVVALGHPMPPSVQAVIAIRDSPARSGNAHPRGPPEGDMTCTACARAARRLRRTSCCSCRRRLR